MGENFVGTYDIGNCLYGGVRRYEREGKIIIYKEHDNVSPVDYSRGLVFVHS